MYTKYMALYTPHEAAFMRQKASSKRRGIEWNLSFDEWLTVWIESGELANRGSCKGQFVMARVQDAGPYEVGNVEIKTCSKNISFSNTQRWQDRQRIKEKPMSRKRADEPYVQQKINLPATLAARFTLLHWDPVGRKVKYGAFSEVVSKLLSDYVNKTEAERGIETQ